jgi:hypothetical protein
VFHHLAPGIDGLTNGVEADLVHARRVQVTLLRPSWVGILSPW